MLLGTTFLLLVGCSTKKNNVFSRSYHKTVTKFNVMFNGNEAFSKGLSSLRANYQDNFWEVLPVERLTLLEDDLGDRIYNPNFQKAEEKAVKSIQKHSMVFDGKQRNSQIDEAYLLLGQARYFDQRFVPAQEALRFFLQNYAKSDRRNEGIVWLAKTHVRLEQESKALESLDFLLEQKTLSTQIIASAQAVKAMAHLQLEQPDSAIAPLQIAAGLTKDNELAARYAYILGQLYENKGERDSAATAFQQVVDFKRKIPRVYFVNAQQAVIRNSSLSWETHTELFEDAIKNRENRPFLHLIHYQRAAFCLEKDSTQKAVEHFNEALRANTNDRSMASSAYESLATHWFGQANYPKAAAYLDSTLTNLAPKTRKHRSIQRKRENLDEVIAYETLRSETDSILKLTRMSPENQRAFFKEYLEKQAALAEKAKADSLKAKTASFDKASGSAEGALRTASNFYFYNRSLVEQGKKDFERIWGKRSLTDNWNSVSSFEIAQESSSETEQTTEAIAPKDPIEAWVQKIPTDPNEIDSLVGIRNKAYFDTGITYKEKFSDFALAQQRFESLLSFSPPAKLKLKTQYHLYKTLVAQNDPKSSALKATIVSEAPKSAYAELLRNPSSLLTEVSQLTEAYNGLQEAFDQQNFEAVIASADQRILQTENTDFAAKFALLRATAIGRLDGKEAYQKALETVIELYPRQSAGIEATQQLSRVQKWTQPQKATNGKAKVVFPFVKTDTIAPKTLQKSLLNTIAELNKKRLSVSIDVYNRTHHFVVVHGFKNKNEAAGFSELLQINRDYLVKDKNFVVLSSDYKNGLIYKTLDSLFEP